jgi:hypothetical protein
VGFGRVTCGVIWSLLSHFGGVGDAKHTEKN